MKFDLKTPCKDCPFRNDRPGYLRKARARDIANALDPSHLGGGTTFTCHKTTVHVEGDDEDEEDHMIDGPNAQHCAGALIMLEKSGRLEHNQTLRIMARLGAFNPEELDLDAPVHASADEWIRSQT